MTETKNCRYCNKEFSRKPTDYGSNWAKRQFCSKSCAANSRQERNPYVRDKEKSVQAVVTPSKGWFIWG